VNEQNENAIGFYKKMGFYVINRSALDNEGLPYPILHMIIKQKIE
jgi:putative acetyltransferase